MKRLVLIVLLVLSSNLFALPSMSTWDGVAHAVKNYMKSNANNPKSIKYVECSPMLELSNGMWAQRVKFRGENAYGATVLNEYIFLITGDGMDAVVIAMDTMDAFSVALSQNGVTVEASYNIDGTKL